MLPPPPRPKSGYQELTALRTGDEITVIAGVDYEQKELKTLRFDPETRIWRSLPPSGIWWRFGYTAVPAGDSILLWGSGNAPAGSGSRGQGFELAAGARRWEPLPQSPLSNRTEHTAVWTGREMIIWGGEHETIGEGKFPEPRVRPAWNGASYDPASGEWRRIPAAPLSSRYVHTAIWSGEEMVVWGGTPRRDRYIDYGRSRRDGAAYDPGLNRWRRLPPAPIRTVDPRSVDRPAAVWSGEEMIVVSGQNAAAYEPGADRWRKLPDRPTSNKGGGPADNPYPALWNGYELVVFDWRRESAYDPVENQWRVLPAPPILVSAATSLSGGGIFALTGIRPHVGAQAATYGPE